MKDFANALYKLCDPSKEVQTKDVLWAEGSLIKADKTISSIIGVPDGHSIHQDHWGTTVNTLHERAKTLKEKILMLEDDVAELMTYERGYKRPKG